MGEVCETAGRQGYLLKIPEFRELFRWLLRKKKRMPREMQTVEVKVMRFQRRTRTLLEM